MSTAQEFAAALLWLATVALMIVKTPASSVLFYRVQALADAVMIALIALTTHAPWLWLFVGLTVVVRVVVIPEMVQRVLCIPRREYGGKSALGIGSLVVYALLLSTGGLLIGRLGFAHPTAVGLVFAAMFVAFMHLSARYEIWSMLWALLSLDTVVDAGVAIFSHTMPETTTLALYGISLSLAAVLAFVAQRIYRIKGSLDVRTLEELMG